MSSTTELHKRRYDLIVNAGIAWANMNYDNLNYMSHRKAMIEDEKELAEINKILNLERK